MREIPSRWSELRAAMKTWWFWFWTFVGGVIGGVLAVVTQ